MITFYPCNIEMWRESNAFSFDNDITLIAKEKYDNLPFDNRGALIEFLKEHGVKLTDLDTTLKFVKITEAETPWLYYHQHGDVHAVLYGTLLGWEVNNFR